MASAQQEPTPRGWVVVENLTGTPDDVSIVLDCDEPRSFSKSARRAGLPASCVETLVKECLASAAPERKLIKRDNDQVDSVAAIPVLGPAGGIFAIAIWSASALEPQPPIPVVGAVEWTPSGLLTANPAADWLLRPPYELPNGRTVVELLASFDRFDDRAAFLDMFNFQDTPADAWTGTATKAWDDGSPHQFHLAARAVGTGENRRIRAIVCDVTVTRPPGDADLSVAVLRAVPIMPGHALAMVDLKSAFVHEWLTEPHSPMAGWRHHNPLYDHDGRERVAATCYALATGTRDKATIEARVRFNPDDDWIQLTGIWTHIPTGTRPQAILDLTPSPNPPPPIRGCGLCEDLARGGRDHPSDTSG